MNKPILRITMLILLFIACLLLGALITHLILPLFGYEEGMIPLEMPSHLLKTTLAINHFCAIFLPAILFVWIYKKDFFVLDSAIEKVKSISGVIVLKAIGLIFLGLMVSSIFVILLEKMDLPTWMNSMDEKNLEILTSMLEMNGLVSLFVNLFIIAVLPALGEELLFRAVIQNELLGWIKNHHYAIILSSFLFAAFHLEIIGLMPKFAIGLVLGYVYYWSGNIVYPMILHFINNGFQVVLLYVIGSDLEATAETPGTNSEYIIAVIAIPLIYLLAKSIRADFHDRSSA